MKVLFICGSLEPGRDGVGDYTRRLAGELIHQGHFASIIALNDPHAANVPVIDELKQIDERNCESRSIGDGLYDANFQTSDGIKIPILRLPRPITWSRRMQLAKRFVDLQNPDWLSLQFVPYSFHSKGLPVRLASRLKKLGAGRKWHVMFHELWVGLGGSPTLRTRCVGAFQRRIVKLLITRIRPESIHTNCTPHLELIQEIGSRVDRLPLFENVKYKKSHLLESSKNFVFIAHFGSVRHALDIRSTSNALHTISSAESKKPKIIAIGRGGPAAERTWQEFRNCGVGVFETGNLNEEDVSKWLQSCSIAFSSSSPDLIEKSSAAATMFSHGLPVLVTRTPLWGNRFLEQVQKNCPLAIFDFSSFSIADPRCKLPPTNNLKSITHMFLDNLA